MFRDGDLVEEVHDIRGLWRKNFVAFTPGCSYSFAARAARLPLFITHTPAHMLICDTMTSALAAF